MSALAEVTACEALASRWEEALAGVVRGAWSAAECADLAARVRDAREHWTADFGGEQYTLGRAFYTHLETGRAGEYFAAVRGADALVERVLPGVQARVRADFGRAVGGVARARPGFCGPGVHVFPAGSKVALAGGVAHWDVEGIAPLHLARRCRAASLVLMLQPGATHADLTLWHARWDGRDEPSRRALAAPREVLRYGVGDLAVFSSYRLHRIEAFAGETDRVSLTLHGVEVDAGVWETWF